jgi:hypothetical protein
MNMTNKDNKEILKRLREIKQDKAMYSRTTG